MPVYDVQWDVVCQVVWKNIDDSVGNMSSNQIMSGFLGPLENIFPKFGHLLFEPVVVPSKWLFD